MDFRLNEEIERWLKESVLFDKKEFDVIALAGSTKDLVDGGAETKDNFMKHIGVAVNLHKVEKIIIFHHSDCGAYAKEYKFSSSEEEKRKQTEDMREAKRIILRKHPEVEIFLVWGELKDAEGKRIEFEVI